MPYGEITKAMDDVLRPLVKGRMVLDLGSGDGAWSRRLVDLGAGHVHAIDKERGPRVRANRRITREVAYFEHACPPAAEVALVAWPVNAGFGLPGLLDLLARVPVVAYLGSNFGGTACGWPAFFRYLLERDLLACVSTPRNSLIVVGAPLDAPRGGTPEEEAALSTGEPIPWPGTPGG